jgi:myo-inositol-1(or 4)-monophosphatase
MNTLLDTLVPLVKAAAREELLPRFAGSDRNYKADGSIVTEADIAMQERLQRELQALTPDYRLVGEEMTDKEQQALFHGVDAGLWCLDPLDGTSNYAAGIPFFAVSLALLVDRRPVLGIVYDPMRDECFTALKGQGAWLNGEALHCRRVDLPLRRAMAVVDLKRLGGMAGAVALTPPFSSQRNFGSVALDWAWLAASRFHVYLHGLQKPWDYAAGVLILSEAGGYSETLEGDAIFGPELKPRSVVAASDEHMFREWKNWLSLHRPINAR